MADTDKIEEMERKIVELEKEPETKPEEFIGIKRDERRIINDLEVLTIRDAVTKELFGILSQSQFDDLTGGGITGLHLPQAHEASHRNGGADELNIGGLSGELADDQPPKAHDLQDHTGPTSAVDMNSRSIINLEDPSNDQDAATKKWVLDNTGEFGAGDFLFVSADANRNVAATSYNEEKNITMFKGGTLRIKFRLEWGSSAGAFIKAKIYRNGSPVGTERTETTGGGVTYSEDIAGWSPGDAVQLFAFKEQNIGGNVATVREFRIYVDKYDGSEVVLD